MRSVGKRRKYPSSLIFACIKKCQTIRSPYNWKIMAPSFLIFFDPGHIEPATVFSSKLGVHTLSLEQLYGCTDVLYSSTHVHMYTVHCTHKSWRQPGLSRWRILTNESTSRITFMNRVNQSQPGHHQTDRQSRWHYESLCTSYSVFKNAKYRGHIRFCLQTKSSARTPLGPIRKQAFAVLYHKFWFEVQRWGKECQIIIKISHTSIRVGNK